MTNKVYKYIFISLTVVTTLVNVSHAQVTGRVTSYYSHQSLSESGVFVVPEDFRVFPEESVSHELTLAYEHRGWRVSGAADVRHQDEGETFSQRNRLKEASYDFSTAGLEGSVGKKVSSWGVSYAFRPLDILQREVRLQDVQTDIEGILQASLQKIWDSRSLSMYYLPDIEYSSKEWRYRGWSLASQLYMNSGNADWYLVSRIENTRHYQLGVGFSSVAGANLELHGAIAYLSHYTRLLRRQDASLVEMTYPYTYEEDRHGKQFLLGGTVTANNGLSLLFEAWFNALGYGRNDWQRIMDLSEQQGAMLDVGIPAEAVYGNINWNTTMYAQPAVARYNLFLRLSYSDDKLDPSLDILFTPEDGGLLARLNLRYRIAPVWTLFSHLRLHGGYSDSAWAQSPMSWVIIAGTQLSLASL
ncbi:MAG: hypothetical protein OEZ43_17935 [Gammaproteobacteria bacterium]|nr:hypothetical protein [Gammaproteobacteria bacterium]